MSLLLRPASRTPFHLPRRTFTHAARAMAFSQQEWMIIIPDNPGSLAKRMEVRPQHLEAIKPNVEKGRIVFGGASLSEPVKEKETPKVNGSVMIICAETKEEAMKVVESDVYTESKVWDLSKVQIFPFRSAVRVGM